MMRDLWNAARSGWAAGALDKELEQVLDWPTTEVEAYLKGWARSEQRLRDQG